MHITPYLTLAGTEPFSAIMVVIDSSKDKAERFHAADGILDYAGLLLLDPAESEKRGCNLQASPKKAAEYASMAHGDLCSAIRAATLDGTGQALEASKIPWAQIVQMVLALIQQLM